MERCKKIIAILLVIIMLFTIILPSISFAENAMVKANTNEIVNEKKSEDIKENNTKEQNQISEQEKKENVEETNQVKQDEIKDNEKNEFTNKKVQKTNQEGKQQQSNIVSKEILEKKPELEKDTTKVQGKKVAVDEHSITYQLDKKTFKKVYTAYPNTFIDEKGNKKEIDNTLVTENENYTNKENNFDVTLPKSEIKEENPIKVEQDNKKLELVPTEGDFSHSVTLKNAIRYNNVFDGIDYQYTTLNESLKEDIILNKQVEKNEFTYLVKASENLTFKQEANYVGVYENEKKIYTIEAPIMEDAKKELSAGIKIKLEEKDGKKYIKIIANKEWLNAPERVYPVKIDPTITGNQNQHDYFVPVQEYEPNLELGNINFTYVGYDNGQATGTGGSGHGIVRIYSKVNIGDIPKEAVITDATYTLYQRSTFYQRANSTRIRGEMGLYSVSQDWKGNMSWNNQPFEGQEFIDSHQILDTPGYITYNIRNLVNDWVQEIKPNKGICLKMTSENTMQCELIGSAAAGNTLNQDWAPTFSITYTIPDPVDENMGLNALTINLRPMTEKDISGKLKFDGVFAEGLSKPGTAVNYWINPFEGFIGQTRASYSYKFPNSEVFDSLFPQANKYKDKLGNWQTDAIFTNPQLNKLYKFHAQAIDTTNNTASDEKTSDSFIIYQVKQKDTIPYIANYYGVPVKTIMQDNRVQDTLLVENNTLFIRNPNQNAEKEYNPKPLTDNQKKEIDGALRGRHLHCEYGYEPVNLNTGNFYMSKEDASISEINNNFSINRTYNSTGEGYNSMFGKNWDFEYAESLGKLENGTIAYYKGDGKTYYFNKKEDGTYSTPYGTNLQLKEIKYNVSDDPEQRTKYEITDGNKETRKFNSYGLLTNIIDYQGHETKLEYNEEQNLSKIISPSGKVFKFTIQDGKIDKIELPNRAVLQYEYDENNNLVKFIDTEGHAESYQYNEKGQMTVCIDKLGATSVKNEYDDQGRVVKQYDAKGQMITLQYKDKKTISIDGNGNVTTYYYNDRYYTTKIEYPNGATEEKEYDNNGNLIKYKDKSNNVTKYEYDANHNQTKEIRADGAVTTTEYNNLNQPTKIVDFDGKYVIYEYDQKGNLVKTTDNTGITNTYIYDNNDRLISKTDPNGNITKYTYNGANIATIQDANGNTSKLYYNELNQITGIENAKKEIKRITYNKNGEKTLEQFPDGTTNTYLYDAKGRMTATIDAKGNKTEYKYDINDNVIKAIKPDGGIITMEYDANKNKIKKIDELGKTTSYQYDSLNRLIKEKDPLGNETKYNYDNLDNITKVTDARGNATQMKYDTIKNVMLEEKDANNNTEKYEYNTIGLVTKKTDKEGLVTEYLYDEANRIKEQKLPTGEIITYSYDNNGNILKVESNTGRSYQYQYDKLNNITKIIDAMGNEQKISYDVTQNVETVTDVNGQIKKYVYDKMGRVTKAQNELQNTESFAFDLNGNQTKYTDFNGNETNYKYDSLNRINQKIDALGNITKYEYDSTGNLIKETDALGNTTTSEYSINNQITKVTDANGHTYKLEYDSVGNIIKEIDSKENETTLEYDKENNLVKTTNAAGTITDYKYDATGKITEVKDNIGNKITYKYDKGRLTKLEDNVGRSIEYQYDLAGNITQIKNYDDTITKYEYDLLDRLTKYTDPEGKITTFEYDKSGNLISKTDDTKRIWKYEYDKLGNIIKIADPQNATTKFEYDANSNLLKTINALGNSKTYTYNKLNQIISETNENNNKTQVTYNAIGQITSIQKPEGGKIQYLYDGVGNKIKDIDELGNETKYSYDEIDNLIQEVKPNGATTKYEYDKLGNITKITDALGNVTQNKVDANGLLQEKTLPNGAKYSYTYDNAQRLTKIKAPEGVEKTFKYDKADNVIEETDGNKNTTKYEYDIMKRLKNVTNANGSKTSYEYDTKGNLSSVINAKGAITKYEYNIVDELEKQTDPTGVVTTFEHDLLGNVTKQDKSGERITTFEYDKVGNLLKTTNALGKSETYTYNKDNNLIANTDVLGNKNTYKYDLKGQLIQTTNTRKASKTYNHDNVGNITSVTDELGNTKKYSYDLLDRLTEVEDEKAHKTTYKYDSVGNLTEQTDANGVVTKYGYDQLNRLKQITDAQGNTTTYNYDKTDNVKEIIKPDGNKIKYDYDKINNLISKKSEQDNTVNSMYGYDEDGKLIKMNDHIGSTFYEYDNAGRISKVNLPDGKQLEYKYDELSRLNEIVYPDGKSVKYTYDVLDNLKTVIDRDGNTTTYEYDAKNRVTKTTRPNGSYTSISYNELDAVSKVENYSATEKISTFEYKYNDKGQIVKETATNQNTKTTKDFTYDVKGELQTYTENSNGIISITTYSYDKVGNRISKELKVNDQNVTTNYTYNNLNQLTKETTNNEEINYKYDANGNLVEKQDKEKILKYNYTVEDRLSAVKDGNQVLMAAIYDGNGDRVFTISPKQKQKTEENTGAGNGLNNDEETQLVKVNMPYTGGNKSILVYILYLVLAVVILLMLKSKSKKLQKTGIATVLVTIVATSVIMIMPKQEESTESIYAYCESPEKASEPRQINENTVFIPLGINKQDKEEYELTQYINDVTSQNTQVLMQYSNNGQDKIAYNYGNERLSYEVTKQDENLQTTTQNYTYNYDGRGSVTNVLDNTGKSVLQYSYNAFGETTINGKTAKEVAIENYNAYQGTPDETLANTYQFNAEDTNNLTGLQYLRARYYDSNTGRFTTEDTYTGNITNPLTRNLYLYTNNDPVNYVDPSGHWLSGLLKIADTVAKVVSPVYRVVSKMASQIGSALIHSQNKTVSNFAKRVKNVVEDTINRIDANSTKSNAEKERQKRIISQETMGPKLPSNKPVYKGAAVNTKVEKSRELENQIKLLRSQNTAEANKMAEYLQNNMKKLCESNLIKLSKQSVPTTSEKVENYLNGISHSIQVNTMGVAGLIAVPITNGIQLITGDKNIYTYDKYMNDVEELVEESSLTTEADKDEAYYIGREHGDLASIYMAYELEASANNRNYSKSNAKNNNSNSKNVTSVSNENSSKYINPNKIRYSQSSVNGSSDIIQSMKTSGWQGEPIDVVKMPDGIYTTIDNTRVVSAKAAQIDVKANIHSYNDTLPSEFIERFTTKEGVPRTWGEAIELRVKKQKASFKNGNPYGKFNIETIK